MENLLKTRNLSVTPFRTRVLSIIHDTEYAVTASYIEKKLDSFNRITLYRTLKSFVAAGLIHEISISGKDSSYALCKTQCTVKKHEHQHIHFSCHLCNEIFCVEYSDFPSVSIPNFQIDNVEIQASGTCSSCLE